MVDRPKKPSALSSTPGPAPQAQVNISHSSSRVSAVLPTGESIEVLLYGATIISWKDAAGNEKLWLSEKAKLDGTKPVRGGVPLVFPVFGPPTPDHAATSKLPQHGFARISQWEFLGKSTSESPTSTSKELADSSVKLDFGLSPSNLSEESRALWPHEFGLIYSVTLGKDSLITTLVVRNEGEEAWEFKTLLHTYFKIKDISSLSVTGLEKSEYIDKVTKSTKQSPASPVTISSETDRVYAPKGAPSDPVSILEGGKKKYSIVRDNLTEVVVWNPWTSCASIGDFAPATGYKEMICVEAGAVKDWQRLEAGETWEGGQIITAVN